MRDILSIFAQKLKNQKLLCLGAAFHILTRLQLTNECSKITGWHMALRKSNRKCLIRGNPMSEISPVSPN